MDKYRIVIPKKGNVVARLMEGDKIISGVRLSVIGESYALYMDREDKPFALATSQEEYESKATKRLEELMCKLP